MSWLPLILFHHCPHSLCSCHAGLSAHQQTCQARCLLGSLAPAASCAWTLFLWISTGDTLSPLSEISSNVTASTSSGRRDKVLHVGGWPKRTETCFLTDLEPNSPKSSCQKGVLLVTVGNPWLSQFAVSYVTPAPAAVITWLSFLHISLSSCGVYARIFLFLG